VKHRIAVIRGDGIGPEVMAEGLRALDAVGRKFGIGFDLTHFDWGCDHYLATGAMMPADVAGGCLYLAFDEASFITDTCIEVGGGRCI
jgi:isocitrate/isopropylmalate dehydrogenase